MSATARLDVLSDAIARVREITASAMDAPQELTQGDAPVILRGYVDHWPVVAAARNSPRALKEYLLRFDVGAVVPVAVGPADNAGRIFYKDDFAGLNIDRGRSQMKGVLERVAEADAMDPAPLIYMASVGVDECLPGFRAENDIAIEGADPLASIWIGTRTRIAAHNDLPRNIACVASGRRRFTLFPPDQIANLYIGPFDPTPAGRPISLVDFAAPDFERFPRFTEALQAAQIAELEPGDALFIPSMWWHHVEALSGFNILVNYWWRTTPSHIDTPQNALVHAMLTIRDLPDAEKKVWKHLFEHYVFENGPQTVDHIPERVRGVLGDMDAETMRRNRALLLNMLNR